MVVVSDVCVRVLVSVVLSVIVDERVVVDVLNTVDREWVVPGMLVVRRMVVVVVVVGTRPPIMVVRV